MTRSVNMNYRVLKLIAYWPILTIVTGLVLCAAATGAADNPYSLSKQNKGVITLDPGHGGDSTGARGQEGSLEKEVCLALARRLTTLLEPSYRVILTRSDDYNVPLLERTAVANHQNADVLISLHTAASFLQATTGIAVYSYKPAGEPQKTRQSTPYSPTPSLPWHRIQEQYMAESQKLAASVQKTLQMVHGLPKVSRLQAPLVILEGANMPAILIEVSHITNPAGEKRLNNDQAQTLIAQAIINGVTSYLTAARKP